MLWKARADGIQLPGTSTPLDTYFLKFIHHHGFEEATKIFSTDLTMDEKREAFNKMVSDFNSKPLKVDEDEAEGQDLDLEDDDEDADADKDEDEGEANGKSSKLFGDTKRSDLVKRLHSPIRDELEPKKPRIAESSCVHGDKTEAAGIKNSSLQDKETNSQQQMQR